jgi:hypothetical protein
MNALVFEMIVFIHSFVYNCQTPEDGFRKERSIRDDVSQGGHASKRRLSQKEGRNVWALTELVHPTPVSALVTPCIV